MPTGIGEWAMGGRVGAMVRSVLGRRWVRRLLVGGVTLVVATFGLGLLSATGGIIVRDSEGCPRSFGALGSVSWTDVVHVRGRMYDRVDPPRSGQVGIDGARVGEPLGTVACLVDAVQRPGYDLRDGEASSLPVGTPLHAIVGVDVARRIVAVEEGIPVVYEAR